MLNYFATALHFLSDVLALTDTFLFPIHKLLLAKRAPITYPQSIPWTQGTTSHVASHKAVLSDKPICILPTACKYMPLIRYSPTAQQMQFTYTPWHSCLTEKILLNSVTSKASRYINVVLVYIIDKMHLMYIDKQNSYSSTLNKQHC